MPGLTFGYTAQTEETQHASLYVLKGV